MLETIISLNTKEDAKQTTDVDTLTSLMVRDDFESWKEILSTNYEYRNFVLTLPDSLLRSDKLKQIRLGMEEMSSIEQLSVYAKSGFNSNQMNYLRQAFLNGLTIKQVEFFAHPSISYFNMWQFVRAFKFNLKEHQLQELLLMAKEPNSPSIACKVDAFDHSNKQEKLQQILFTKHDECKILK